MIPRDVRSPTLAIPFHKLLKVVVMSIIRMLKRKSCSTKFEPKALKLRSLKTLSVTSPKMRQLARTSYWWMVSG